MKVMCTAAILLAAAIPAATAQPSVATATVRASNTNGSRVSLISSGNATGFATVTIDGRTKTIGATSAPNGTVANIIDIDALRGTPVMSEEESDPTDGVPAPPVTSPPEPPSPGAAGGEGMVRLVDRVDVNGFATGTLQVFCEGAWGAVCSSNFDDRDAQVACRQLGFPAGSSTPREPGFRQSIPDSEALAPFALENLGCQGNETRLVDCPVFDPTQPDPAQEGDYYFRDYASGFCDPFSSNYATVACGTSEAASEGDLRLAQSVVAADGSAEYGRLEVFHNSGWGTVCDNAFINRFRDSPEFSTGSADVACRQLGYQEGFQIQALEDMNAASIERAPIVLPGSDCTGSEQTLAMCPDFRLGEVGSRCRHNADVHLVCFNGPNPEMDGATRLVDGSADPQGQFEYGRLEIFARGFWSNVCNNDRFTPDAAQVACKALGYDGGAALRFTQSYANSLSPVLFEDLPVALAGVDCDGNETAISECQSNNNRIGECSRVTTSTVLACANSAPACNRTDGTTEGSVRLRGGFGTPCDPVHSGFIEILHFDEWGSICTNRRAEDRAEDNLVADVACRQLGFPHGTRVDPLDARPPPPEDEAMTPYSTYYYSFYDYTTAEEAQEPVERFWLNSVACAGPESALIQCDLGQGFRQNNAGCNRQPTRLHIACRQFPVVEALEEITTPGAEEGDLRLIDQGEIDNWTTGRLQVFFEGSWSQVCATGFDAPDANVACRQLGFGPGTTVPQALTTEELDELRRTNIFPEIAITGASCTGTEERLVDCTAEDGPGAGDYFYNGGQFGRDCLNSEGEGLVLGCVSAPLQGPAAGTEGEVRLTNITMGNTPGSESGILEIFHAGAWGTLCDGEFGILESTAEIACRDMGFISGVLEDADMSAPLLPPWLSGIRCAGPEAEVTACPRSPFGDTAACGNVQRLFCISSRQGTGTARLVGGSADPGGSWEYGILELMFNGVFNILTERRFRENLGRRGAQVACRSLGFAAGAQLLVGNSSPFLAPRSTPEFVNRVLCDGSEDDLAACDLNARDYGFYDYRDGPVTDAVALICTTPSGCNTPPVAPAEGDVRLVPLNGTATATAACDNVHFGGVELFREGRWGRICSGRGDRPQDFTLDAQVVCRQLGFPFGTVMDASEPFGAYDRDYSDLPEDALVWATEVVCTGKEDRLFDCIFPENFEDSNDYYFGYYNENWPAPAHAAPAPAPTETAPPPSSGLTRSRCDNDERDRLAVICRRFEITESDTIRR